MNYVNAVLEDMAREIINLKLEVAYLIDKLAEKEEGDNGLQGKHETTDQE